MRKFLEMRTGMAVDAAPPQPMILIDPGVGPIMWGGTSNLGVVAEKGWTENFGGLSPSAPVSTETGPVGGG